MKGIAAIRATNSNVIVGNSPASSLANNNNVSIATATTTGGSNVVIGNTCGSAGLFNVVVGCLSNVTGVIFKAIAIGPISSF